jgi:hypothetical protein
MHKKVNLTLQQAMEAPTFAIQSTHRWQWGCQPYTRDRCTAIVIQKLEDSFQMPSHCDLQQMLILCESHALLQCAQTRPKYHGFQSWIQQADLKSANGEIALRYYNVPPCFVLNYTILRDIVLWSSTHENNTIEEVCTHGHTCMHVCISALFLLILFPCLLKESRSSNLSCHSHTFPSISWLLLNTDAWMSLKLCKLNENIMM